jgi:hypothetical protein
MEVDTTKNRVRLGAGQAQGISEGAQFVIYPQGLSDFTQEEKQLAIVEVTEVGASHCWADQVKTLHEETIEPGFQAVLLSAPVDLIRRIRLIETDNLPHVDQTAALREVEQALLGNGWVRLVTNGETAPLPSFC